MISHQFAMVRTVNHDRIFQPPAAFQFLHAQANLPVDILNHGAIILSHSLIMNKLFPGTVSRLRKSPFLHSLLHLFRHIPGIVRTGEIQLQKPRLVLRQCGNQFPSFLTDPVIGVKFEWYRCCSSVPSSCRHILHVG